MIKTNLINEVPSSKKFIAGIVILNWLKLWANIVMIFSLANIIRNVAAGENISTKEILTYAGIVVAAIVVRSLCTVFVSKFTYLSSADVKKVLRGKMYDKLTRLGAGYHEKVSSSEVVQVFVEGVDQMELYFGKYLPQFFYAFIAPLTLFAVLCPISVKASIILFICVPLIPAAIVAVQKIAKKLLSKYWGVYTSLGDTFLENIQGLTTLKVYQADERKNVEMNEKAEEFRRITMKVLTMQLNSISVMDIVAYAGSAIGVVIAVAETAKGKIDIGQAFAIIMLAADFFLPMRLLGSYFHVAMNGMAASDKLFKLLDIEEDSDGTSELENPKSDIKAESLSFSYGKDDKYALKDLSFSIPYGSFTAIIGESGCGKSTLASLLCSTAKGYEGKLKIGSDEVSQVAEKSMLKNITAVNFNSYIFAGTVKENLLMGKPDASDDELIEALKKVNLWNFLESQKGLDTELTNKGANFSGGQRQRLALARALLHESSIYIFDEITSSVDAESEADIMKAISALAGEKTVIMISHRLANVVPCDNIYLLDKGQIVASGKHPDLIENCSQYREMFMAQQEIENVRRDA